MAALFLKTKCKSHKVEVFNELRQPYSVLMSMRFYCTSSKVGVLAIGTHLNDMY